MGLAYYGNGLHPGAAQVIATVYRQVDGMPVLTQVQPYGAHPGRAEQPALNRTPLG